MKILITGAEGFVGKNTVLHLKDNHEIFSFDVNNTDKQLAEYINNADYIIHLAGANRPINNNEFYKVNTDLTSKIVDLVKKTGRKIPIIFSSTIQAALDNDYGKSKKQGEDFLIDFEKKEGNPVYIFRFHNIFGKWSRPNYNSVVATFCYNIARNIPIKINDPEATIDFVYIDDVVKSFEKVMSGTLDQTSRYLSSQPIYNIKIGNLADIIYSFKQSRKTNDLPLVSDPFTKKLYSTYLTYLAENDFEYILTTHKDNRGSFTEFVRMGAMGQVSVNVIKPGITKGDHYHHTKTEKFLVVTGRAEINFRKIDTNEINSFVVGADNLTVLDIPPGHTHSITNICDNDVVFIIWANELYNPLDDDTIFEKVEQK